jgi:hypothetical protein
LFVNAANADVWTAGLPNDWKQDYGVTFNGPQGIQTPDGIQSNLIPNATYQGGLSMDNLSLSTDGNGLQQVTINLSGIDAIINAISFTGVGTMFDTVNGIMVNGVATNPEAFYLANLNGVNYWLESTSPITSLTFSVASFYNSTDSISFGFREESAPTPEPASLLIFGLGLTGLGMARRRMSK